MKLQSNTSPFLNASASKLELRCPTTDLDPGVTYYCELTVWDPDVSGWAEVDVFRLRLVDGIQDAFDDPTSHTLALEGADLTLSGGDIDFVLTADKTLVLLGADFAITGGDLQFSVQSPHVLTLAGADFPTTGGDLVLALQSSLTLQLLGADFPITGGDINFTLLGGWQPSDIALRFYFDPDLPAGVTASGNDVVSLNEAVDNVLLLLGPEATRAGIDLLAGVKNSEIASISAYKVSFEGG